MKEIPEIPECKTIEELTEWLEKLKKEISSRSTNSPDRKDWIPVERKVFIDYFSLPSEDIDEQQDERISLPNLCIAEYRRYSKKINIDSESEE